MKILLYGINFSPELTGIGKYTGEMASWLASRGHDIKVVTAPPYYPEWKVGPGFSSRSYQFEVDHSGVEIWRCPLWVPVNPSGLKRILHLASFSFSSLPILFRYFFWKPDLVFVVEPPLFCAPAARLFAFASGAKSWLHIQDFEVDAAFELGLLRSHRLRQAIVFIEKQLLRSFHRISTISNKMIGRLKSKEVNRDKIRLLPNWVDVETIFPLNRSSIMRQELSIGDEVKVALYSGNMGEKQGLDIVVDAANSLQRRDDLLFVLCGDGAAKKRLQKSASTLNNIIWLPLQPMDKLNELLNLADIHLLPQRAGAADLVMPSKLTGIFASGRAVVATAMPETELADAVEGRGIVTSPGKVDEFSMAIETLLDDVSKRNMFGKAARNFAENNLSIDHIMNEFEEELKAL